MTRKQLFDIADEFGLTLALERVTIGPEDGPAFREFEFTGDHLADASAAIRHAWNVSADFCTVRRSDIDGEPYLLVTSFWCEPAEKAGAK